MALISYLELSVADIARSKAFFTAAFGADFTDFGPTYASTMAGAGDPGLQADRSEQTAALLPVTPSTTSALRSRRSSRRAA
jgi:predicted enzyme related to lactoylglutathione lyase